MAIVVSVLGILAFFSALAATGHALSCTHCDDHSSFTCSGPSMICAPGFACGSIYMKPRNGGYVTLERRCVPKNICNFKGNLGFSDSQHSESITCCDTDYCTPPAPTYLPISDSPNGLVCPSCVAKDSTLYDAPANLKCTGSQDRCLLMSMETTEGPGALKSSFWTCATQSYCDRGTEFYIHRGEGQKTNYLCSSVQNTAATSTHSTGLGVQNVALTPAVVCLLLLTWLF